MEISRLYVRFFDVQWDGDRNEAIPRSTARFRSDVRDGMEVVPTIYITNETMRRIPSRQIDGLAEKIVRKVDQMIPRAFAANSATGQSLGPGKPHYREIQIDCDWTASSRTSYFAFLDAVRELLPEGVRLSATIRLHQVKYRRETGTPPVDRGLLMAYNTGTVTEPAEENSIISYAVVDDYLDNLGDYPLPLDVALPIFAWGVRFHFDRFASLIPEVTSGELVRRKEFRQIAPNRFVAETPTDVHGEAIEVGDVIRTEETSPEEVLRVAELIAGELPDDPRTIVLYRYDPLIFARYETARLLPLYRAFD